MKKSAKIALGGLIGSVSIILMLLTGIFPFASYALPAVAGALLICLVIEYGYKWALLAYVAVALLSLIIAPDMIAKILYITFFGYYPILKGKLEQSKSRAVEWALKLVTFNLAIGLSYLAMVHLFRLSEITNEMTELGQFGILAFWIASNVVFVLYDVVLTKLVAQYINQFRGVFLRKFK